MTIEDIMKSKNLKIRSAHTCLLQPKCKSLALRLTGGIHGFQNLYLYCMKFMWF